MHRVISNTSSLTEFRKVGVLPKFRSRYCLGLCILSVLQRSTSRATSDGGTFILYPSALGKYANAMATLSMSSIYVVTTIRSAVHSSHWGTTLIPFATMHALGLVDAASLKYNNPPKPLIVPFTVHGSWTSDRSVHTAAKPFCKIAVALLLWCKLIWVIGSVGGPLFLIHRHCLNLSPFRSLARHLEGDPTYLHPGPVVKDL